MILVSLYRHLYQHVAIDIIQYKTIATINDLLPIFCLIEITSDYACYFNNFCMFSKVTTLRIHDERIRHTTRCLKKNSNVFTSKTAGSLAKVFSELIFVAGGRLRWQPLSDRPQYTDCPTRNNSNINYFTNSICCLKLNISSFNTCKVILVYCDNI